MKMDLTKSYGLVCGHPIAKFEQNGVLYGGDMFPINANPDTKIDKDAAPGPKTEENLNGQLVTDRVESATAFLKNILSGGAIGKPIVFAEAQKNNQEWDDVKTASAQMGVKKLSLKGKPEMWSLPEYNAKG